MLDFQPITETSIAQIAPYVYHHPSRMCDFTAVNLYMWAGRFYKAFAIEDDMLYLQLAPFGGKTPLFAPPIGQGDFQKALARLRNHCEAWRIPFRLSLVAEEQLSPIGNACGFHWRAHSHRDWCDYVYDAKAMAAYEGKAYAKQRNHVRKFERLYPDWRAERLTPKHISEVEAFLTAFENARETLSDFALEEIRLTSRVLSRQSMLGLFGVVLYVGDRLVGFSAGSRSADTVFVHFEKADVAFEGVYQKLVQEFARRFVTDEVLYINREEDCGEEGLRRSKLAYQPVKLICKYTLKF